MENRIKKEECISLENYELLKGKFLKVISSQLGSRILQNYISNSPQEVIVQIFDEIKKHISDLIVDQYGNYFCQKFFTCLPNENRVEFLEMVII